MLLTFYTKKKQLTADLSNRRGIGMDMATKNISVVWSNPSKDKFFCDTDILLSQQSTVYHL